MISDIRQLLNPNGSIQLQFKLKDEMIKGECSYRIQYGTWTNVPLYRHWHLNERGEVVIDEDE